MKTFVKKVEGRGGHEVEEVARSRRSRGRGGREVEEEEERKLKKEKKTHALSLPSTSRLSLPLLPATSAGHHRGLRRKRKRAENALTHLNWSAKRREERRESRSSPSRLLVSLDLEAPLSLSLSLSLSLPLSFALARARRIPLASSPFRPVSRDLDRMANLRRSHGRMRGPIPEKRKEARKKRIVGEDDGEFFATFFFFLFPFQLSLSLPRYSISISLPRPCRRLRSWSSSSAPTRRSARRSSRGPWTGGCARARRRSRPGPPGADPPSGPWRRR